MADIHEDCVSKLDHSKMINLLTDQVDTADAEVRHLKKEHDSKQTDRATKMRHLIEFGEQSSDRRYCNVIDILTKQLNGYKLATGIMFLVGLAIGIIATHQILS